MIVKELFARIGLDVAEDDLHKVASFFSSAKVKAAGLAGAVIGIGAAFFELARETAQAGEQVARASERVGLTTDAFQEMAFAAEETGVSVEAMEMALNKLNLASYNAKHGSAAAAEAFHGLLSMHDLKNTTPDQQLQKLADGFLKIKDPAERAHKVTMLFGRAGRELIPLLNKGSAGIEEFKDKAHEFGMVMSAETIANSKKFNEQMREMHARLEGIKRQIGSYVLDKLLKLQDWFRKFRAEHPEAVFQTVRLATMGLVAAFTWLALTATQAAVTTIAAWLLAAAPFIAIGAVIAVLLLALDDLIGWFEGKDSVIGDFFGAFDQGAKKGFDGFVDNAKSALGRFWDGVVNDAGTAGVRMFAALFRGTGKVLTGLLSGDLSSVLAGISDAGLTSLSTGGAGLTGASMGTDLRGGGSMYLPPIPLQGPGGGRTVIHAPVNMTVQAAPGMDEKALAGHAAKAIAEHQDRTNREAQAGAP